MQIIVAICCYILAKLYRSQVQLNRRTRELIKQLQSENPKERYIAAAELAKHKDIDALPALNKVATFDQNENVRTMAYNAVRFLNGIKSQIEQDELRRRVMEQDEDDDSYDTAPPFWEDAVEDVKEKDEKRSSGVFGSKPGFRKSKPRVNKKQRDDDDDDDDDSEDGIRVTASDLGIPTAILFGDDDDDDDSYDNVPFTPIGKKGEQKSRKDNDRRERRRRANFKLVLWLSVIIGVLGLAIVASQELADPRTREDAIVGLDGWLDEMIETTGVYTASLEGSTFDCTSYVGNPQFDIPAGPDWAERDGKNQEDLGDFFDGMEQAQENLSTAQRGLDTLCQRSPDSTSAAIPESANWAQLVSETSILHLSKAANALANANE